MKKTDRIDIVRRWAELAQESRDRKNDYLDLLRIAKPEHVAQRTHLYTTAALELYIVQAREQAAQSFEVAKNISVAGFLLIFVGAVFALFGVIASSEAAKWAAIVSTIGGVITELVGATVFVLYSRSMEQFNNTLLRMTESQRYSFDAIDKNYNSTEEAVSPSKKKPTRI